MLFAVNDDDALDLVRGVVVSDALELDEGIDVLLQEE